MMSDPGYMSLISYKLSVLAFDLGWEFVPLYYNKYEDNRQRDQIKQALRSTKQNIVEGSSERSLSSKLKLYDVAKASGMEAREDFEDILRRLELPRWNKNDPRLVKLRSFYFILGPGEIRRKRWIRRNSKLRTRSANPVWIFIRSTNSSCRRATSNNRWL